VPSRHQRDGAGRDHRRLPHDGFARALQLHLGHLPHQRHRLVRLQVKRRRRVHARMHAGRHASTRSLTASCPFSFSMSSLTATGAWRVVVAKNASDPAAAVFNGTYPQISVPFRRTSLLCLYVILSSPDGVPAGDAFSLVYSAGGFSFIPRSARTARVLTDSVRCLSCVAPAVVPSEGVCAVVDRSRSCSPLAAARACARPAQICALHCSTPPRPPAPLA
jgi:hypothetical protein